MKQVTKLYIYRAALLLSLVSAIVILSLAVGIAFMSHALLGVFVLSTVCVVAGLAVAEATREKL